MDHSRKDGMDLNQGVDGIDDGHIYSTGHINLNLHQQNIHQDQMSIPTNRSSHMCPPNSSTQFHHTQLLPFPYNQFYPNVPYLHQPLQPSSPYYQQPFQPIPYPIAQPQGDLHASHHTNPFPLNPVLHNPVLPEGSQRLNKNWTKEEDLQLTIAYFRISTDSAVGVGQKKPKFWDRVLLMFHTLMHNKHGITPQSNQRNVGGCENRMNDIKTQCTRWVGVRTRSFLLTDSGWSTNDYEKHCHSSFEKENKRAFRWEECWNVLKELPNWQECNTKKSRANKRPSPSSGSHIEENTSKNTSSNTLNFQTQNSPITESTHSSPRIGEHGNNTCTPDLDGPASQDIERPSQMKKTKANNQRQRKIIKHSESQASASQSVTDGFIRAEALTTSWRAKQDDLEHMRDLKDDERYKDTLAMQVREHDLKVAKERCDLIERIEAIGEKLIAAIEKLDELDPRCLANANHMMVFECRKKAVANYRRQYEGTNFPNIGTSQRRLFDDEDEPFHLDQDN